MLHVSNEREARQDQQQLQSTRQQKKHTISVCPSTVTFLYNFNIYFIFNSQLFSYTRICCCKKLKVLTCKWFPTKKNQNQFCCLETFLNIRQTIAYFEQFRLCRCCVFSNLMDLSDEKLQSMAKKKDKKTKSMGKVRKKGF